MTLIITLAIPLCIMVTITALYFAGWSLNMATMMGLMLSLGLVVDNAIVIVENIFRLRQSGVDPRRASIEGAGEVGLPVTMATLTTVVVFLPLVLMGSDDNMAFWMLRIGVPVMVGSRRLAVYCAAYHTAGRTQDGIGQRAQRFCRNRVAAAALRTLVALGVNASLRRLYPRRPGGSWYAYTDGRDQSDRPKRTR